jgi:hypothetical protein
VDNHFKDKKDEAEVEMSIFSQLEHVPVKPEAMQRETGSDYLLSKIYEHVTRGWSPTSESKEMDPYFTRYCELTIHQDCIFWGIRVVIPPSLRGKVQDELHQGHMGVTEVKTLARRHSWWPDYYIELFWKDLCCMSISKIGTAVLSHPMGWSKQKDLN